MIELSIFVSYCLLILLTNCLFKKHSETGNRYLEAIGGLVFLLLAILLAGTIIPLYLTAKHYLLVQMWPDNPSLAIGLLIIFYSFARTEMISKIVSQGRELKQSFFTFLGPLAVHFSSTLVTIGITYPWLKTILPLPVALFIASLMFPIYHLAQFHFFPVGLKPGFQFQILGFSLGYVLFYELTSSFILTFALQHLIATTTFIHNRDYQFGERDFPFYFGIIVVVLAVAFCSVWLK
jgi:hypothetical protein